MNKEWLEQTLHTKDIQIQETDWGLSNTNLMVTADGKAYVLRIPGPHPRNFVLEHKLEQQAKELNVPVINFDTAAGYKLTRYIPNLKEFHENQNETSARQVGQMLKTLHQKPAPTERFDPFAEYNINASDFPYAQEVIEKIKDLYQWDTFCHNDLVSGNLLFGPDRSYLIDYEFAGANDRRFDIASFFSENQITDESLRNAFYEGYQPEDQAKLDQEVKLFELFEDILWAEWARQKAEATKEEVYQEIREEKRAHYMDLIKKVLHTSDDNASICRQLR